MVIAAVLTCLPIVVTGGIARCQGVLFLAYYVAYTLYVVLNVMEHDALRQFKTVIVFALRLTAVALAVLALRERLAGSATGSESPAP